MGEVYVVPSFVAFTVGIIVYFVGAGLNRRIAILKDYNIPEPVTGGILASLAALGVYVGFGIELEYEMDVRDQLMVYFFTAIGLNARFKDLIAGGRPLVIMLVLTLGYIVFQDVIGVAAMLPEKQKQTFPAWKCSTRRQCRDRLACASKRMI